MEQISGLFADKTFDAMFGGSLTTQLSEALPDDNKEYGTYFTES